MAYEAATQTRAAQEGRALISSERVDGTSVYDREGEKLGAIHHLMIDKRSGKVEYAVMSFGGLFGLGEDYYPLPWHVLSYDSERGGYAVNLDKDVLNIDAPHYGAEREPGWDDDFATQLDTHYERVRL
ncbi:PRC-barrel domain-containing protein [Sphingomonas sp. CJ20]